MISALILLLFDLSKFLNLVVNEINFFFFCSAATTKIYPLSLHDALPICLGTGLFITDILLLSGYGAFSAWGCRQRGPNMSQALDRKSTRLNSSHQIISYAVFCLKKKNCFLKFYNWLYLNS